MQIIVFILVGLAGGVVGGMGMGGGTFLIPLLVIFGGVGQHLAQAINLLAFIPMSLVALIFHIRNGLVKFKYLFFAIPATAVSVIAALISKNVDAKSLSVLFGYFLILLGLYQLLSMAVKSAKSVEKTRKDKV